MLTAKQKRKENIAEYILYLWQLEDLFRALNFEDQQIYKLLVDNLDLDDSTKQMIFYWYVDMGNILKSEGKKEHGHMDLTIHLIGEMNDLHNMLIKTNVEPSYNEIFNKLAPHIPALRNTLKDSENINDIELCFRALYGYMLQHMKDQNMADKDVLELISPLIAKLSDLYLKVEKGELDIYKKENN